MKILFDTNVVLDFLLDREPFSRPTALLFSKVETDEINGYLCATTVTTIYHIVQKYLDSQRAKKSIQSLLKIFVIAGVNRSILESAYTTNIIDYEDAVLHEAARQVKIDGIVTRNISDFKKSTIRIYSPLELLQLMTSRN